MSTVNRGMLLRRAKAGRLLARCTGHYTDDYLADAADNFGRMKEFLPVVVVGENERRSDHPGKVALDEDDFRCDTGMAYENEGRTFLRIHRNLRYEVRITEENKS